MEQDFALDSPTMSVQESQKIESESERTSGWCEVNVTDVPPVDLINLDASIKLSEDYLDMGEDEEFSYRFGGASSRFDLALRWLRTVTSVLFGSIQRSTVFYLSPAFTGRLLLIRRLSMFTGVVAPVVLGQFAQIFLRGGE